MTLRSIDLSAHLFTEFRHLTDNEIDDIILAATKKSKTEQWIKQITTTLQKKFPQPDTAHYRAENFPTTEYKLEHTRLMHEIQDAITIWKTNNRGKEAEQLSNVPENWTHDVADHLKKNFIIKFFGIETSAIEAEINQATHTMTVAAEKNKTQLAAIFKIYSCLQEKDSNPDIHTIHPNDASVLAVLAKEGRTDETILAKINWLFAIKQEIALEKERKLESPFWNDESISETLDVIDEYIPSKPITLLHQLITSHTSLSAGLAMLLEKIATRTSIGTSNIGLYEKIYHLASQPFDYQKIEESNTLTLTQKKLNRLWALRQEVNHPHWNNAGTGLVGKKIPTHINKLRDALANIPLILQPDMIFQNYSNDINTKINKTFDNVMSILTETNKEETYRHPNVKALYDKWYPIIKACTPAFANGITFFNMLDANEIESPANSFEMQLR